MKKRGSLKTLIILILVGVTVLTSVLIEGFVIIKTVNNNNEQVATYKQEMLSDIQAELRHEVDVVYSLIDQIHEDQLAGKYTEEEAKLIAANFVRDLRYDNGDGYFWIDTSAGDNVVLLGRDTEGTNRYNNIDPNGVYYIQEILNAGLQDGGGFAYFSFAKPNETEPLPKMSYSLYYEPYDWVIGTGVWIDQIDSKVESYVAKSTLALYSIICGSILMVVSILIILTIVAFFVGNKITKPIIRVSNELDKMASGDFCNTEENQKLWKLKSTNNEIGQMAESLEKMHSNIRDLMVKISDTTSYVAAAAQQLSASASQSADASELVANSCTSIAGSCQNQIRAVAETSSETKGFISSMEDFSNAISRSADMIGKTNTAASQGGVDINNAMNQMNIIKESVEETSGVIDQLGEQLQTINTFVDTISSIASQTNLLSLNASIEAARAGEAGKGFAVVAQEINQLADQSDEASKQISEKISDILEKANSAMDAMKKGLSNVQDGTEVVQNAGNTFNDIVEMVHEISEESSRMQQIVGNLSSGTNTIAADIEKIEDMSSSVAEETESVSAASQQQTATSHEIAEASDKLAETAQELQSFVVKFEI
ncbi:MAG: cache domain-containing protein [Butyrivibrio sp.]|nr:cache domain-containing protein [Butyrivibrio sp.]